MRCTSEHTTETRLKEHDCTPSSDKPVKLAVAEHSISHNHYITTPDTKTLSAKSGYNYRLIMETTELMLNTYEQGEWPGLTRVMETSHSLRERRQSRRDG